MRKQAGAPERYAEPKFKSGQKRYLVAPTGLFSSAFPIWLLPGQRSADQTGTRAGNGAAGARNGDRGPQNEGRWQPLVGEMDQEGGIDLGWAFSPWPVTVLVSG